MNTESFQVVVTTLESFKNLKHGWNLGQGHTYNPDHLDWLILSLEESIKEIECPYVYPSLGRNCVRFEFDAGFYSVDVEINLELRVARVTTMLEGKSSLEEGELLFSDPQTSIQSWKIISEMVRHSKRISQEKKSEILKLLLDFPKEKLQ